MKFLSIKDIRGAHAAIRKSTNKISRETHMARTQIKNIKVELEKMYENTGMTKFEKKQAVERDLHLRSKDIATNARTKYDGELRTIEKNRLILEGAREFVGNPLRRINAMTALDKTLAPQRAAVAQLLLNASPAELETIALAARDSGDLATLAACVSKNSSLPVAERRLNNAAMIDGVVLPDQLEINAVLKEVESLPAYALSCDRSLNNRGVESGTDKIERGLHDRQVDLQNDGALKPFEFEHKQFDKIDDDKPKPKPEVKPEDLNPEDFDTPGAFMIAGGESDVVEKRCAELWPDYWTPKTPTQKISDGLDSIDDVDNGAVDE